jgi:hypothetical protein
MAIEKIQSLMKFKGLFIAQAPPVEIRGERKLEVNVIFSTDRGTQAALNAAQELAKGLNAVTVLLVPQVVPLQFPLSSPPVSIGFTKRRALALAQTCQKEVDIRVQIYLCVDKRQCLLKVLQPRSLVLIGGRKRWWPAAEQKLARALLAHGHRVIFVRETE